MLNYFCFPTPNTHCALVIAMSEKKASPIQYGYRKCGTHARMFSQPLLRGNSKNEIRQRTKKKKIKNEAGAK